MPTALDDSKRVTIWNVATGKEVRRFQSQGDARRKAAFSRSNRYLAVGEHSGDLNILEIASGRATPCRGHNHDIAAFDFSPDERLLATAGTDGVVKVWVVATGRELARFPMETGGFWSIAFSPDSHRLVAGTTEGVVKFWDMDNLHEVAARKAHTGMVWSVGFIDDDTLVSLSRDSLRIWRAPKLAEIEAARRSK